MSDDIPKKPKAYTKDDAIRDFVNYDTFQAKTNFQAKEYASEAPYISCLPSKGPSIPVLRNGALALELKDETTIEEAQALAALLNEKVRYLTYTGAITMDYRGQVGRGLAQRIIELDGMDREGRRKRINEILTRDGFDAVDWFADPPHEVT